MTDHSTTETLNGDVLTTGLDPIGSGLPEAEIAGGQPTENHQMEVNERYSEADALWSEVVEWVLSKKASDIHFSEGEIWIRLDTELIRYPGNQPSTVDVHDEMLLSRLTTKYHKHRVVESEKGGTDFALTVNETPFRGSISRISTGLAGTFRRLPTKAYTPDEIGLPERIMELTRMSVKDGGLILVTGETGSGKSSTLCTLLEHLNQTFKKKIITFEDPIEFRFTSKKCMVNQREIGREVNTFIEGITQALRQDPNIFLVGEIRDAETAMAAITAAETGHLVFSTLHTDRVSKTISRYVQMVPDERKNEVRANLANNLKFVMGQKLFKKIGGGMVAGREIFINTPAAAHMIIKGEDRSLETVISTNREIGMVDWTTSLRGLQREGYLEKKFVDELCKDFMGS